MIINGTSLLTMAPIKGMETEKKVAHGTSYGLSEAGYDIRIKQTIIFHPNGWQMDDPNPCVASKWRDEDGKQYGKIHAGRFILASAIEEFQMPDCLVGVVHDKSSWARKGLSVFNTVIEPGWKGFLTLELVYHGTDNLLISAGSGIAQVLFRQLEVPARYEGKYQNQEDRPVAARDSKEG